MKSYDIKFELGQEVYILTNKAIHKSRIEKIRVVEGKPYKKYDNSSESLVDVSGIEIDYMVVTKEINQYIEFEWYPQDEVFETKQDVFNAIK